jgi:hypothetical protein
MFNSIKVNQSGPPLRWIANLAGEISGWAILKAAYLDEDGNYGWRYNFYSRLFVIFNPISMKYGTHYILDALKNMDMSGPEWDDYDENGIPYWEKTGTVDPDYEQPWRYVDLRTGDAFRIIKKGLS